MGFKFLKQQQPPDEPAHITQERFRQLIEHQLHNTINPLSVDNRPAVFLQLNRNRNTIDDNEWNFILQQQRRNLIDYMWEQGMVVQTIVSQDIDGFSLRTEILF